MLRNSPDEARERIRDAVMDLFRREQDRLEGESRRNFPTRTEEQHLKARGKANSIDGFADYLFSRGREIASGDSKGPLANKMDDIDEWDNQIKVGNEWNYDLKKWASSEKVVTPEERIVIEKYPTEIEGGKQPKDYVMPDAPWEGRKTTYAVPGDIQEILVEGLGPRWRNEFTNKKVLDATVDTIKTMLKRREPKEKIVRLIS